MITTTDPTLTDDQGEQVRLQPSLKQGGDEVGEVEEGREEDGHDGGLVLGEEEGPGRSNGGLPGPALAPERGGT